MPNSADISLYCLPAARMSRMVLFSFSVIEKTSSRLVATRGVVLDLSTRELEFEHEMFPVNIIFDSSACADWEDDYKEFYDYAPEYRERFKRFRKEVA